MGIVAIFGGTFNPIHIGHCEIIEEILKIDSIEKVIVIPAKIPPHKSVDMMASEEDRMAMCRLATKDLSRVEISDIELKREGKSYTVDTLRSVGEIYPEKDIAITIGADMVVIFDQWKDYKTIISSAKIITFSRTATDDAEYQKGIDFLSELGADVITVDKKISDISSTKIRELISCGKDAAEYLPKEVSDYIKNNKIYGG